MSEPLTVMIRVGGKRFHCARCGSSVFTRSGNNFACNGCGAWYEGTDQPQARAVSPRGLVARVIRVMAAPFARRTLREPPGTIPPLDGRRGT
jgi:tRNA(Ile2) C34 agmatinyltransferase TiaS